LSIISWQFAIFVGVALVVHQWLAPRWRNLWLLIVSGVFVATYGFVSLGFLIALTCANYSIARRLDASSARRQLWLWFGISLNVLLLILYRLCDSAYADRFLKLFGLATIQDDAFFKYLLPIGFLFYGLQAIAYLIDLSNQRIPVETSFVDFALFLGYFPKLLSGPIERARVFLPQLKVKQAFTRQRLRMSTTLILTGLVRKIVIADVLLRQMPNDYIWQGRTSLASAFTMWLLIIRYAFVLYNDFAGYTNIVQGVSLLFGLELSPNFKQPFFSRSFSEFWTRWHISLSEWLRDYIFFPISRSLRRKFPEGTHPINVVLPPMVTMLVSGLWHGLSVSLLLWGGLHGLFLAVERLVWIHWPTPPATEQPRWRQIVSALWVFGLVTLAWVPFSRQSLVGHGGALEFWQALFSQPNGIQTDYWLLLVFLPIGLSLWIDWMQYHARSDTVFLEWPRLSQAFLISSALLLIIAFSIENSAPLFIYQGF